MFNAWQMGRDDLGLDAAEVCKIMSKTMTGSSPTNGRPEDGI